MALGTKQTSLDLFHHRFPVLDLGNSFFELFGDISAYGELNPPKGGVSLLAVLHEIMLIPGSVGTEIDLFHLFGKEIEGLFQDPELFKTCGNISVPELRMEHQLCFSPPDIEGLIGLKAFIGKERVFLLCLHERGIHIKGRFCRGAVLLDGGDEVPVYLYECLEMGV